MWSFKIIYKEPILIPTKYRYFFKKQYNSPQRVYCVAPGYTGDSETFASVDNMKRRKKSEILYLRYEKLNASEKKKREINKKHICVVFWCKRS